MVKLILPVYWTNEKKTKPSTTHLLGMNWYRNAHFHPQNAMKKYFHSLVSSQITTPPLTGTFKLNMGIYYKNPSCDGANIAALIEKFTLDALQTCGIITNDNVNYHLGTSWEVVKQDKTNPRCMVSLISLSNQTYNNDDTLASLEYSDPFMVKIRTYYFESTGDYGSDKEVKDWYLKTQPKIT